MHLNVAQNVAETSYVSPSGVDGANSYLTGKEGGRERCQGRGKAVRWEPSGSNGATQPPRCVREEKFLQLAKKAP